MRARFCLFAAVAVLPWAVPAAEEGVSPTAAPVVLLNPSMTVGDLRPIGWDHRSGTLEVRRDTNFWRTAPASLCVDRRRLSGGKGSTAQVIEAPGGTPFKISGWLRGAGDVQVTLTVLFYTADWRPLAFEPVKQIRGNTSWTLAEGAFVLPTNATRFGIALEVQGQGLGWLDEVQLTSDRVAIVTRDPLPDTELPQEASDPRLVPVTPTPNQFPDFPDAWREIHRDLVERTRKHAGPLDLLLLGDSLNQGWGGGWGRRPFNEAWRKHFGQYKTLNLAVGGDKTQNVLWRLAHGEGDGLSPRVVVLSVGVHNLPALAVPIPSVAEGIRACVASVRAKFPQARVLLVCAQPAGLKPNDPVRQRATDLAQATRNLKLETDPRVRVLDLGERFTDADGFLRKESKQSDFLRLSPKGYESYAAALQPVVEELLKQ